MNHSRTAKKLKTKFKFLTPGQIEEIIHIVNGDRSRVRVARIEKDKVENKDLWYMQAPKLYHFVWDNGSSELRLLFDPSMKIDKNHCTLIRYEGIPTSNYINSDLIRKFDQDEA